MEKPLVADDGVDSAYAAAAFRSLLITMPRKNGTGTTLHTGTGDEACQTALANIVDGAKKQQRAEQNLMTNRGFDLEHGPGFNLRRVFWRSPAVGLKHV